MGRNAGPYAEGPQCAKQPYGNKRTELNCAPPGKKKPAGRSRRTTSQCRASNRPQTFWRRASGRLQKNAFAMTSRSVHPPSSATIKRIDTQYMGKMRNNLRIAKGRSCGCSAYVRSMRKPHKKKKRMTPNWPKNKVSDFGTDRAVGQAWPISTEMMATPRRTSRFARLPPRDVPLDIRLRSSFSPAAQARRNPSMVKVSLLILSVRELRNQGR